MSTVIAIIPARAGSKGVPDKNIKPLAGKPLMAYSIAAAKLTNDIDRVIVSTDSQRYADIAKEYGAEVPFLRPRDLSKDSSTDYEFIRHTLDWFQSGEGKQPEFLVHLRPTTPLRNVYYIESAIETIKKDPAATALRSVHEMPESAYKSFEIDRGYLKCVGSGSFELDAANSPRQKFPKTYQANGYVDIIKSSYVLRNQKIHGNHVIAFVTPYVVEVDTEDDFNYLEYRINTDTSIVKKLFI